MNALTIIVILWPIQRTINKADKHWTVDGGLKAYGPAHTYVIVYGVPVSRP